MFTGTDHHRPTGANLTKTPDYKTSTGHKTWQNDQIGWPKKKHRKITTPSVVYDCTVEILNIVYPTIKPTTTKHTRDGV
jgi:hypothetical protein